MGIPSYLGDLEGHRINTIASLGLVSEMLTGHRHAFFFAPGTDLSESRNNCFCNVLKVVKQQYYEFSFCSCFPFL